MALPPSLRWILGVGSVVFDIDVGQRIEHLIPAGCLSKEEQQDVAFHSFPDSMSMELHARSCIKDSTFFFRIRRRGTASYENGALSGDASTGMGCSPSGPADGEEVTRQNEERFLYGYVFCRQRQDASLRRGGEQLSVVVLAEHPLSAALAPLSAVAGQQYFGNPGEAALRQVYEEVCRWPAPVAGPQLQLPVGFTALTARLPAWNTLPHPSAVTAAEQYGGNMLARPSSMRTLVSRRGTPDEGGGSVHHARSGSNLGLLSPVSSSASSFFGSTASNGGGTAAMIAGQLPTPATPSPFTTVTSQEQGTKTGSGPIDSAGLQQPQSTPPAQQHLEPRLRSPGPPATSAPGLGLLAAATAELSSNLRIGTGAREGPLQAVTTALSEGLSALHPHPRSIMTVQVPSRASSQAGAPSTPGFDELASASSLGGTTHGRGTLPEMERSFEEAITSCSGAMGPAGRLAAQVSRRLLVANNNGGIDASVTIHGAFHEVDVFTPLCGHLQRLWQLWEMTLLGRALMVVAPTPGETSSTVAALLSLVAPLPYAPDFRPYYCIHDPAFSRLASGALPGPEARDVPTLLGVTNLYFVRALPHWPNILSVGKREGATAAAPQPSGAMVAAAAAVQAIRQRAQGASTLLSAHTEALWANYKPLLRADQGLLSRLIQPKAGDVKSKVARIAFVNSDAIRRHFAELTTAFLSPFSRYFEPGPDGRVPGWNSEEFLFGLRSGDSGLPAPLLDRVGGPAAAVELYARFTSSLNFAAWFAARRRPVAHLIAPFPWRLSESGPGDSADGAEGGIGSWFSSAGKHIDEVKLIGIFFNVEQQLMDAQAEAASPDAGDEAAATVSRLQRELALLFFGGMPEELQLTCISSPARRQLLAALPLSAPQAARVQQLLDMLQIGGK